MLSLYMGAGVTGIRDDVTNLLQPYPAKCESMVCGKPSLIEHVLHLLLNTRGSKVMAVIGLGAFPGGGTGGRIFLWLWGSGTGFFFDLSMGRSCLRRLTRERERSPLLKGVVP